MPAVTFKIENNSCISKCCSQASLDIAVSKRNSSCFSSFFRCCANVCKKKVNKKNGSSKEEEEEEKLSTSSERSECGAKKNI